MTPRLASARKPPRLAATDPLGRPEGAVAQGRPSPWDENAYNVCMEANGYEKVPKDFVPPK